MKTVAKLDDISFADPNDPALQVIQGATQGCFKAMLSLADEHGIHPATFCASAIAQMADHFAATLRKTDPDGADRFARQMTTLLTRHADIRAMNEALKEPRQ